MQPARGLRDGGAQRWALVGISYENFTDLVITGARWTRVNIRPTRARTISPGQSNILWWHFHSGEARMRR